MIHCPSCGSGLRFDIASQKTVCDHCRNAFEPQSLPDSAYDDAESAQVFDSFAVICPDCGAEMITTDANDAVGFCPYCGGASVIHDKLRKEWNPDAVIPFAVTKEQCKELYIKEVKKDFFVSRKYCHPELIEGFRGIYMPYSSYRTLVQGNSRFKLKSAEKNVGNYDYETQYFSADMNIDYEVDDASVHETSLAFDDHLSEQLEPFDTKGLRPFNPGYLCGFYAETGDVDAFEYASLAQDKVKDSVYEELRKDPVVKRDISSLGYSFDKSHDDFMPMQLKENKRRLYPVWFMSYRRGDKITYAAVKGQTGKLAADLPLSPLRILLTILGCSAAIFALLFILMRFLPTIPATTTLGVSAMLSLIGMYIMQHSFIRTVGKTLHSAELDKKIPVKFYVSSALSILGVILSTTDGTRQQTRFAIGAVMAMVGFFLLISNFINQANLTSIIKRMSFDGLSMQQNGILAEAKGFRLKNTVYRLIFFVVTAMSLTTIISDTAAKELYFIYSAVLAVMLFGLALLHIFFQTKVALRRLPQFNKKGAAYDEN